jgi:hypothetical protein
MTTSRNARPAQGHGNEQFGLLANGSAGEWHVDIDEALSGVERWYAQVEGPAVSFYFEIPSPDIVSEMLRFLESPPEKAIDSPNGADQRNDSLVIGNDKKTPLTLFKDDEYPDRFFLVVGQTDSPLVRFVLAGLDAVKIAEALRQVQEDLEDEG